MKDRILLIMKREQMTQQEFASAINVSPASLSNIFNGKTNPTINHVYAIHQRFPSIDMEWLVCGDGDMTKNVANETGTPSSASQAPAPSSALLASLFQEEERGMEPHEVLPSGCDAPAAAVVPHTDESKAPQTIVREVVKYIDKPQRKITEIRIFFDDGTFEVFSPK